jgi:NAD(P)-dependent dehydrogenase (short-subunit alcohol dehydrogenase family)
VQGTPFAALPLEDFAHPIIAYTRTHFVTAKAAARHMAKKGSGVILILSTPGSRLSGTGYLGYGVTCAAKEGFSRLLAAELAPSGIRVNCLMPHAIPEASAMGSHSRDVFAPAAAQAWMSVDQMLTGAAQGTLLKRLPTLAEVADVAAFMASDRAGAMTGTVANMTCGQLVD